MGSDRTSLRCILFLMLLIHSLSSVLSRLCRLSRLWTARRGAVLDAYWSTCAARDVPCAEYSTPHLQVQLLSPFIATTSRVSYANNGADRESDFRREKEYVKAGRSLTSRERRSSADDDCPSSCRSIGTGLFLVSFCALRFSDAVARQDTRFACKIP